MISRAVMIELSDVDLLEFTLASEMVFTNISKDVEYSFMKNRYNIFVVSSQTTFHHV